MTLKQVFTFPDPVNDYAARTVAAIIVVMALGVLLFHQYWLLIPLAYGFLARVLTGPTLSPAGLLATRLLVPRFIKRVKLTPGPPKRLAQSIGLLFSTTALVLWLAGLLGAAQAVLAVLTLFAALEAVFAFCMGCFVFAQLMHAGLLPAAVCESCNNLSFTGHRPPTERPAS